MANEDLVDRFITMSVLAYEDEYRTDLAQANALLRANPQLADATIWSAATVGNATAVARFLADDPALANRNGGPRDHSPLLCLCYSRLASEDPVHNAVATAKLLVDRGADVNASFLTHGTYRFTCLTGLIGEGEGGVSQFPPHPDARELVTLLLQHGADPNDSQGLYNSMFTGGTHWLQLLIDHGLNNQHPINWAANDGLSTMDYLLAHACQKNMLDRVVLLLENGANPNAIDWYQKRPCYEIALSAGNTQVVELLVAHGADVVEPVNDQERFYNACMAADRALADAVSGAHSDSEVEAWISTADSKMKLAADAGKLDALALMIDLGFPIGDALFEAAWHGQLEAAKMLVEYGASVRRRHHVHFATPVGFADHAGKASVRAYLVEQDIDIFDAIRFDRVDRVAEIIEDEPVALERPFGSYTAQYTARQPDNAKHTPLVQAVVGERLAIVRLLLERGANTSAAHSDGRSLRQVATDLKNQELVELLR